MTIKNCFQIKTITDLNTKSNKIKKDKTLKKTKWMYKMHWVIMGNSQTKLQILKTILAWLYKCENTTSLSELSKINTTIQAYNCLTLLTDNNDCFLKEALLRTFKMANLIEGTVIWLFSINHYIMVFNILYLVCGKNKCKYLLCPVSVKNKMKFTLSVSKKYKTVFTYSILH